MFPPCCSMSTTLKDLMLSSLASHYNILVAIFMMHVVFTCLINIYKMPHNWYCNIAAADNNNNSGSTRLTTNSVEISRWLTSM